MNHKHIKMILTTIITLALLSTPVFSDPTTVAVRVTECGKAVWYGYSKQIEPMIVKVNGMISSSNCESLFGANGLIPLIMLPPIAEASPTTKF